MAAGVFAVGIGMVGPTLMRGAPTSNNSASSPRCSTASKSGARDSPNPARAPTWPGCGPARCATATTGRERSEGLDLRRAHHSDLGAVCSSGPIPTRPSTRASPRPGRHAHPGITSGRCARSPATAPSTKSSSRTSRSRTCAGWVRSTRVGACREHHALQRAGDDRPGAASVGATSSPSRSDSGATQDPVLRQQLAQQLHPPPTHQVAGVAGRGVSRNPQGLGPEASVLKLAASRRRESSTAISCSSCRARPGCSTTPDVVSERLLATAVLDAVEQPDRWRHRADPAQRDR